MPKGGAKNKLKKKLKKQNKKKTQESKMDESKEQSNCNTNSSAYLTRKVLLDKYDIKLGPEGYIPGGKGPKSIHISEFSMLDPGGGRELLSNTEIMIGEGNIYGLVGKNGFGKTTLLKHMFKYDIEGMPRHIRMIIVNQEELITNDSILDCILQSDEIRQRLFSEEDRLTLMGDQIDENDTEAQQEINALLQIIWDMTAEMNYDQSEKRAMKILIGLGFTANMIKTNKIKDLSGGWQMRIKIAKALFVEPDLMLLDEPTNHLDFPTVLWLQNYLKQYHKTIIVVSHDREFLNNVCSHMIHLTQKKLLYFKGNYFTMQKTSKNQMVEQVREYDAISKQIENINEWIRKYKDKGQNMASAVQSKRKILENLENEAELLEPPSIERRLKFDFPDVGQLEDYICRLENVNFKYPSQTDLLLRNISLQLNTDSRIGMIGANGVGKSTIIKLILGQLHPLSGECSLNRHARIALFTQYHMDQLNLEQNAIQFLIERFADDADMRANAKNQVGYVRSRLGRFKLTGKQHTQKMKFLSGGQKSRVAFCVATWTKPHFLIMDEPTNHLDMETIDSLINAIGGFPGGVLVISHDQHFLMQAADEYWAVTSDHIRRFEEFENAKSFALEERIAEIADNDNDNIGGNLRVIKNTGKKSSFKNRGRKGKGKGNVNNNGSGADLNDVSCGKKQTRAEKRMARKIAKANQNQMKKKQKNKGNK